MLRAEGVEHEEHAYPGAAALDQDRRQRVGHRARLRVVHLHGDRVPGAAEVVPEHGVDAVAVLQRLHHVAVAQMRARCTAASCAGTAGRPPTAGGPRRACTTLRTGVPRVTESTPMRAKRRTTSAPRVRRIVRTRGRITGWRCEWNGWREWDGWWVGRVSGGPGSEPGEAADGIPVCLGRLQPALFIHAHRAAAAGGRADRGPRPLARGLPLFRLSDSADDAVISLATDGGGRWRVLPSPGDRLPGTFDQDVYVELLRRFHEAGSPADGAISFTLHAFLRAMGRRVDGRTYEQLRGASAGSSARRSSRRAPTNRRAHGPTTPIVAASPSSPRSSSSGGGRRSQSAPALPRHGRRRAR